MSSIELTPSQRAILQELVNLFQESERAVKGEAIAAEVDRNPGTIRNQMQSLKALQLVEGVPGPKGGYKPTAAAYDTLQIEQMEQEADVPLYHNDDLVPEANERSGVWGIRFVDAIFPPVNRRGRTVKKLAELLLGHAEGPS